MVLHHPPSQELSTELACVLSSVLLNRSAMRRLQTSNLRFVFLRKNNNFRFCHPLHKYNWCAWSSSHSPTHPASPPIRKDTTFTETKPAHIQWSLQEKCAQPISIAKQRCPNKKVTMHRFILFWWSISANYKQFFNSQFVCGAGIVKQPPWIIWIAAWGSYIKQWREIVRRQASRFSTFITHPWPTAVARARGS